MFQVFYLCAYQPVMREDLETYDWNQAVQRCNLIGLSRKNYACVMQYGQVVYQVNGG